MPANDVPAALRRIAELRTRYDLQATNLGDVAGVPMEALHLPSVGPAKKRICITAKGLFIVTITNVTEGVDENGDSITYTQSGTAASMAVLDRIDGSGGESSVVVSWDLEDGSSTFIANGNPVCWDTFEDGQVDVPCPSQ